MNRQEARKADLRKAMAARRDALSPSERSERSRRLCRVVARDALAPLAARLGRPLTVAVYGAFRSEADPAEVLSWCAAEGHRAVAPRVREDGSGMELRIVASQADWQAGRYGAPAPDPLRTVPLPADERPDVVLVPGMVFDRQGGRIGYGGGYYDRLAAALGPGELPLWIGFAFELQLSEAALPMEAHDLRLDGVATERGLTWFSEEEPQGVDGEGRLTHFNEQGRAVMVDVSDKATTARTAVAESRITMAPSTLARIADRTVDKGDVLAVAQVAAIQAAKRTSDWIPMCHPLPLTGVSVTFGTEGDDTLTIEAEVKTTGKTGVEMEALTAVSAAALTVYDMCKALQKDMVIGPTLLRSKTGGKSGDYRSGGEAR